MQVAVTDASNESTPRELSESRSFPLHADQSVTD